MKNNFLRGFYIEWDSIGKDSFVNRIPALKGLDRLSFDKPITLFCGENGSGKSTLLEAIATEYGFNPEGGTVNFNFSTYDASSDLDKSIVLTKGVRRARSGYFFRAESCFNVPTMAREYGGGYTNLHEMSHGESFMSYFDYFSKEGLYLLDEPEAALSPQNQLNMYAKIVKMVNEGSQFIIATHSPILLGLPNAQIYNFTMDGVKETEYEKTDSYVITKSFLNKREMFLKELFDEI